MSMSSKKCCVPGCLDSGDSHKTLHLFPHPVFDKQRFNTWVYSVGGDIVGLENQDIYQNRRVCHAHFEDKFCCRYNRISKNAVPTLHLPGPLSLPRFTFFERRATKKKEDERFPLQQIENLPSTSKDAELTKNVTAQKETTTQVQPQPPHSFVNIPVEEHDAELTKNVTAQKETTTQVHQQPPHSFVNIPVEEHDAELTKNVTAQKETTTQVHQQPPHSLVNIPVEEHDAELTKNVTAQKETTTQVQPQPPHSFVNIPVEEHGIKNSSRSIKSAKKSSRSIKSAKKKTKYVSLTPTEQALYRKLVAANLKLSKCRNKLKKQANNLKTAKKISNNPKFFDVMENFTSTAKLLTLLQFRECKKSDKGRRFTLEEKIVALSILKNSAKTYKFLRKIYILPSPQTLIKMINDCDIHAGINKKIFQQLQKKASKMKEEDKLCLLIFDEMSLSANITYNERKDRINGFVNNGQNISNDFADHAQVFMIRGLMRSYKQPVAYTFACAATKGPELARQIKTVVTEIQRAGFCVVATVCDQGTNNTHAIKLLTTETQGEQLRRGLQPKQNIIIINGQEIVPLYDPPHMLKCIRNNFLQKNLKYSEGNETKIAKWGHLELLHQLPSYKGLKLIPKLSDNHIIKSKIPKMKVKYASQIFSRTVATNMGFLADHGILPEETRDTADILIFFDNLFDSLNGSHKNKKRHGKPLLGPVTPLSVHHDTWKKAKKTLNSIKFIDESGREHTIPTLKNWAWTLDGIEVLLNKLAKKYNITSVWTRHLNQDPIENFFGSIRSHGCRNNNPTPENFESAFTALLINNLSSVHAPGANCEKDLCSALYSLVVTGDSRATSSTSEFDFLTVQDVGVVPLENKTDPQVLGALHYVSGYFVKEAKKKIFRNCQKCYENFITNEEDEYIKYREYAGRRWLIYPSKEFVKSFSAMQDIIDSMIKTNIEKYNIKELITTIIFMIVDFDYIVCEVHREMLLSRLISMIVKFFIFNYCKKINKILKGVKNADEDDVIQMKAKKYYNKCYKRKK